ncbi:MAG: DUF4293 domain-containing protein [Bacteroidales bacterium]|jgi:uncharacterized membrane protein (UPF0182 family)|nr:DUF4293 domain-containing protein [Bacteroidales bacterium]MDD3273377.1 DUF4293 domain-containing protein [Bacteroidales bacterium]MDD4057806.1 DUF4293 domain-containing protein [Bacteroidales bacterium]
MIQRIQTLFLLAATALLSSLFFVTIARSQVESVKLVQIMPLLVFNVITAAISFITIFLFKKRMLQVRLTILNSIILIGYQAWIVYLFINRPEGSTFTTPAVFPIVAAILSWLAFRYIARDEAMVRAADRLRK